MSTNSRIGIENEDGSINSVYCHWDGYLAGVGYTLLMNYSDRISLETLIRMGNVSSLGENLYPQGAHTFKSPEEGVTVFYGRDRGEIGQDYEISPSLVEFVAEVGEGGIDVMSGEEFGYVLRRDGTWTIVDRYADKVIEENGDDEIVLARAELIRNVRRKPLGG